MAGSPLVIKNYNLIINDDVNIVSDTSLES